jgi:hypothetical protein
MLGDGSLWIGTETWPSSSPQYELMDRNPTDGIFVLGVDTPTILPGVSIQDIGNVARVQHEIDAQGIRTRILTALDNAPERGFAAAIKAIINKQVAPIDYFALYNFKVVSQSSDLLTVDVQPLPPNDVRFSGLSNVPVKAGSAVKVQFQQNAVVLVGWDGGNPTAPYCGLGLSSDGVQRIQMAGNIDAARKGDHADDGSMVFTFVPGSGAASLSITYTDPDGSITNLPSGSGTIALKGKINEGSTKIGLG